MSGHWLSLPSTVPVLRHQTARVVLCAVAAGTLVVLIGFPYWRTHLVHGAVAGLACAGFAAAGALLATGGARRRLTGRLLLAGGFCWPFAWMISWDSGPGPMLSFLAQFGFFALVGTAILSYPEGRIVGGRDRAWVIAAVLTLVGGEIALQSVTAPEWLGVRTGVSWLHVAPNRTAFEIGIRVQAVAQVLLAAWFAGLLWRRVRWLSTLDRRIAIPVLLAAAALGLISSIQAVVQPEAWTNVAELQAFYFNQGVIALVVSVALVSGALRDRWWELSAPHRVVRITSSGTSVATVRVALADALRDGTLRLYFWAPTERGWVDPAGRPAAPTLPTAPDDASGGADPDDHRWRIPIAGEQHPLAIVDVDASLRRRPVLVDAVLRAGGQALLTAQLQAAASANLAQVLAAQYRLEEKELAERSRLEQELREGAQRRLGDLARQLDGLAAHTTDPVAGVVAGECRDEVLATVGDLEQLAHGLLPATLRERGLGPALEAVAARLRLPVQQVVCPGRFPAAVEATLYFALCEGLTNVAKYAPDAAVRVEVLLADGWLSGSVADDGPGGAVAKPGGGLAGIERRARALSGWAGVDSSPAGTRVRVTIPADAALVASPP
ncbi:sensor histidine kinase [Cryptosporangium minutisporangium]|uniref:histidine kinase n=1 Tax=Cryptosporangium minutisporangium TaxID=113569 RepID=A0ABP6T5L9_9ACTN